MKGSLLTVAFALALVVACGSDDDDDADPVTQCVATCTKAADDCRPTCERACRSGNCTVIPSFPWKDMEEVLCLQTDGTTTVSFDSTARGQLCRAE